MKINWKMIGAAAVASLLIAVYVVQFRRASTTPAAAPTVTITEQPTSSPYSGTGAPTLTPPKDGEDGDEHQLDPKTEKDIIDLATAFATDWSTPGKDAHEWVKRVREHATPSLASKFSFIDVEAVPDTGKVTKTVLEKATEPVATSIVTFENGQQIRVVTIFTPGKGWNVLTFDRA